MNVKLSGFVLLLGLIYLSTANSLVAEKFVFKKDSYTGNEISALTEVKTERIGGSGRIDDVRALFVIQKSKNGTVLCTMHLTYIGQEWIFADAPLDISIDGQSKTLVLLPGNSPQRKVWRGDLLRGVGIQESLSFAVSPADLFAIANAKGVRFRLNGSQGFAERAFASKSLKSLQELLEKSPLSFPVDR